MVTKEEMIAFVQEAKEADTVICIKNKKRSETESDLQLCVYGEFLDVCQTLGGAMARSEDFTNMVLLSSGFARFSRDKRPELIPETLDSDNEAFFQTLVETLRTITHENIILCAEPPGMTSFAFVGIANDQMVLKVLSILFAGGMKEDRLKKIIEDAKIEGKRIKAKKQAAPDLPN